MKWPGSAVRSVVPLWLRRRASSRAKLVLLLVFTDALLLLLLLLSLIAARSRIMSATHAATNKRLSTMTTRSRQRDQLSHAGSSSSSRSSLLPARDESTLLVRESRRSALSREAARAEMADIASKLQVAWRHEHLPCSGSSTVRFRLRFILSLGAALCLRCAFRLARCPLRPKFATKRTYRPTPLHSKHQTPASF